MDDRRGEWENGVNRNLVSLNSAMHDAQKQIEEGELDYAAVDKLLRGDPEKETDGLISRQHTTENLVMELRAELRANAKQFHDELRALKHTVRGDPAGGKGHEQRINALEGKKERSEKREGYFWHFVTATVGSILFLAALMILNWERMEDFFKAQWQHWHPAPITQTVKKKKKRHQKPIVVPELPADDGTGASVP